MVGLGKFFGRSVKNFGRPGQFLKVWKKVRNVREKISEKMYGKKSRGSNILATRGRGELVKFYLPPPPKMRVAPQMPPQIPRPGAATAYWNYDFARLVPRNRNIVNLTLRRTTKNSLSRAAFQLARSGLYTAALSE